MKYVIIGNSTAAIGCVEGIRSVDTESPITLIASEPHAAYGRPLISYLLMGSDSFEEEEYDGDDPAITRVFKGTDGYVIEANAKGYVDNIRLWVGVRNDGYVTGITIRDMDETLGLGRRALQDTDFLLQFLRNTGDAEVGSTIDGLTGATVSSKAICRAVNSAVAFVTGADVATKATEWEG